MGPCWCCSVVIDLLHNLDFISEAAGFRVMVIEEFLKLIGICLLTAYLAMVSALALRRGCTVSNAAV